MLKAIFSLFKASASMVKKFLLLLVAFFYSPEAYSDTSPWEGKWEVGRYSNSFGGNLTIQNCRDDLCDFEIVTANGAHTCGIEGKLKVSGDKAQYREKIGLAEENPLEAIVDFELNRHRNTITVSGNGTCQFYCGMQGYFKGEYENENNPLRFETGFDCWQDDLNDTEKTICATEHLARADKEMHDKYSKAMTDEWKNKRNKCQTNTDCLWEYYVSSIKEEYIKTTGKEMSLYEYLGNLEEDGLYYPTDFTLLDDYFRKNMENKYYHEFTISFGSIAMNINQCQNCFYHQYGIAGLFAWYGSSFYINDKNEIWLAFVSANLEKPENDEIIVFAPENYGEYDEKDIPGKMILWIDSLISYKTGIKFKHFSHK